MEGIGGERKGAVLRHRLEDRSGPGANFVVSGIGGHGRRWVLEKLKAWLFYWR